MYFEMWSSEILRMATFWRFLFRGTLSFLPLHGVWSWREPWGCCGPYPGIWAVRHQLYLELRDLVQSAAEAARVPQRQGSVQQDKKEIHLFHIRRLQQSDRQTYNWRMEKGIHIPFYPDGSGLLTYSQKRPLSDKHRKIGWSIGRHRHAD